MFIFFLIVGRTIKKIDQLNKNKLDDNHAKKFCELLGKAILNKSKMKKNIFENWKKNSAEPAINKTIQIEKDIQTKLDTKGKGHIVKHEEDIIEEIK